MKNKITLLITAFSFLIVMFIYFAAHPSYEKSLEAKYYFETKKYDKAYALANEAFSLDIYNRMASTIMAQSKTALKYQKYINQAKKYMDEINAMADKENISDADRARIKIMSQIVVDSYEKLAPSVITDKKLVDEARKYHDTFEKLLEKVTK